MCKVCKATEQDKAEYRGLYRLYGWVTVNGTRCAIEWLNEQEGPKFEVMAPRGFHFRNEGLHSLLCCSMADLRGRVNGETLKSCKGMDCDESEVIGS